MNQPPAYVAAFQSVSVGGNLTVQVQQFSPEEKEELLVDLYHLPKPTTALVGRQKELNQLTEAFTNHKTRLAIIIAAGGVGKSALTDEWLQHVAEHNYYGKNRVFGWSFYAQGTRTTYTNSQEFFNKVLPFLGIREIPNDEIKKARLLATFLQQQPCLLILDGLEPLQYAQDLVAMNGELQDSALKEFIACFRQTAGKSFVLFSSRQPLVELKKWQAEHFLSLDLGALPHQDGAQLLQALGVMGNAAERQAISQDLNGHALSLVLTGHLLNEYHQGDGYYMKNLPLLTSTHGDTDADAEKDSRHALRVLDYYDSLQDAASRCFLQLLGLFDRPMNAAEKAVLIANANHAEPLRALTAKQWQVVDQRLEKSGLLLGKKGSFERLEWDTHPIIREYFGRKFKEDYPDDFRQAHLVLFGFYQKIPEKKLPDTLEEMLPLYRAVVHGCLAGEYQKALNDVYNQRIKRGDQNYSIYKFGAYSQDLTALSAFFPQNWSKFSNNHLSESEQAGIFNHASFCLLSLGRLVEATELCKLGIKLYEKIADWKGAANSSENLTELLFLLGNLFEAEAIAYRSKEYALRTTNKWEQIECFSTLASALHLRGKLAQAQTIFLQAEQLQQQAEPNLAYLYSLPGVQYCSFLQDIAINHSDLEQILQRANNGLIIAQRENWLWSIALDYFMIAHSYQALQQSQSANTNFDLAIVALQKAGKIQDIPKFYLARADFYLTQNQLDPALADLNSAWEIIERCGMKLYAVDYLLIHGRYSLATADFDTALNHYQEAKQLIEETGYRLCDAELDLFAAQICRSKNQALNSKNSEHYLQKAKNRIKEIGQWGLLRIIKRDFPECDISDIAPDGYNFLPNDPSKT